MLQRCCSCGLFSSLEFPASSDLILKTQLSFAHADLRHTLPEQTENTEKSALQYAEHYRPCAVQRRHVKQCLPHRPHFFCGSPHDLKNASHLVYITDAGKQRSAAHQLCEDASDLLSVGVPILGAVRPRAVYFQLRKYSGEKECISVDAGMPIPVNNGRSFLLSILGHFPMSNTGNDSSAGIG